MARRLCSIDYITLAMPFFIRVSIENLLKELCRIPSHVIVAHWSFRHLYGLLLGVDMHGHRHGAVSTVVEAGGNGWRHGLLYLIRHIVRSLTTQTLVLEINWRVWS